MFSATSSNLFKRELIKINNKPSKVSVYLNYSVLESEYIHFVVTYENLDYNLTIQEKGLSELSLKTINKLIRGYLDRLSIQNGVLFLHDDQVLIKTIIDIDEDVLVLTASLVNNEVVKFLFWTEEQHLIKKLEIKLPSKLEESIEEFIERTI